MSGYLYLDIETLPTSNVFVIADIEDSIEPPGNISKPETIAKWNEETKPQIVAEAIAKTGLSGVWGSICCVGWAWGEGEPHSVIRKNDERAFLIEVLSSIDATKPLYSMSTIVGHNVANFDIRFIWQRAFVLGVRLPGWFPRDPKPWSREVQDTMTMWSGPRDFVSLDKLCKAMGLGGTISSALNLGGKQGMNGADVAEAWNAGQFEQIADYCRADVERVRAVHRKMMVATGE